MAIAQAQTGSFETPLNLDHAPPYPNDYASQSYTSHFHPPLPPQPHASTSKEMNDPTHIASGSNSNPNPNAKPLPIVVSGGVAGDYEVNSPTSPGANPNPNLKRPLPPPSKPRPVKRIRNRALLGSISSLKQSWKTFLIKLDPLDRLNPLLPSLVGGGIDAGAITMWPESDLDNFIETVASSVAVGVRVHFKVLVKGEGKNVWEGMRREKEVKEREEREEGEKVG